MDAGKRISKIDAMGHLTKTEIVIAAEKSFLALTAVCNPIEESSFFFRPSPEKWSAAEHVQHLIISLNTTTLAYSLPNFIVRLAGGKPNRPSKPYEELVDRYQQKLEAGGRANGRFIPKPLKTGYNKKTLLNHWDEAGGKFINALKNKTTESKLDNYLARHPLLGRITLRELCYFTIYHTEHHRNTITQHQQTTWPCKP